MAGSMIVAGARTPIGKLSGSLAALSAMDLGGFAIVAALERAGVSPDEVQRVAMGHVLQAGQGQITARQAAVKAGIPMTVPATNINKVCLSGLTSIAYADRLIANGEADVVIAGGMESMTQAPFLLPGARRGYRLGNQEVVDSMMHDGLYCSFDLCSMGSSTDRYARAGQLGRERQDQFALNSHQRAYRAMATGLLKEEVTPVEVPAGKGNASVVDSDEGVRADSELEALAALRPAFDAGGTVTAGNASQISDGAAAVLLMSKEACDRLGVDPLGEIISYGEVAGPDTSLLHQPSRAIKTALARTDYDTSSIDLFEINEAFAAVTLASMDDLGIGTEITNVNGGAVALGHPIGASGTRLVLTLLMELRRRGGGTGAAGLCGGGGQGDALIVRTA